jgi:hypothetical protein
MKTTKVEIKMDPEFRVKQKDGSIAILNFEGTGARIDYTPDPLLCGKKKIMPTEN